MRLTEQKSVTKQIFNHQKDFFQSGHTLPIPRRKENLKKLKSLIKKNEDLLNEAIYKDLGKSRYETYATEIGLIYDEINIQLKNINKWARRKKVDTNIANLPGTSYIQPHPFGVSLIIGPWNYPFLLCLIPVTDALAAGNTVVLKPSELAPNASAALAHLINNHFPPELISVVEGGIETATELLDFPWDKILFTGSSQVGKIVMRAAAKHLTNVTLELGGKSPVLISDDVHQNLAAKRIVWGKYTNCGQTCAAPDFVLVQESVKDKLLEKFREQISAMYKNGQDEGVYGKIINEQHFDRLVSYLGQGNVYTGGHYNRARLWIEPTILTEVDESSPVMNEEIFGPILPVISFKTWEEAMQKIHVGPHPMAVYVFSNRKSEQNLIRDRLQFGGMTINDTMQHIANNHLPIGGVGNSGVGFYHGKWGFRAFSHLKAIQKKATWVDIPFKYPPFNGWKEKILRNILK